MFKISTSDIPTMFKSKYYIKYRYNILLRILYRVAVRCAFIFINYPRSARAIVSAGELLRNYTYNVGTFFPLPFGNLFRERAYMSMRSVGRWPRGLRRPWHITDN